MVDQSFHIRCPPKVLIISQILCDVLKLFLNSVTIWTQSISKWCLHLEIHKKGLSTRLTFTVIYFQGTLKSHILTNCSFGTLINASSQWFIIYDNFIFALPQLLRSDLKDHRRVGEAFHCITYIGGGLARGKMTHHRKYLIFSPAMEVTFLYVWYLPWQSSDYWTYQSSKNIPLTFLMGKMTFSWMYLTFTLPGLAIVRLLNVLMFQTYVTLLRGKIKYYWKYDIWHLHWQMSDC